MILYQMIINLLLAHGEIGLTTMTCIQVGNLTTGIVIARGENHRGWLTQLPSGERSHSNGKSPCLMGKSTICMAIFNCYVSSPEGILE